MRKLASAITLAFAATWAFAQQQQQPQQTPQTNQEQLDKDAQARIRAEKAAGGLGKVAPEDRANADVGAGPHRQFKPGGAARREHDEDSSEREAGRGATR
jgi:hypothetical protein